MILILTSVDTDILALSEAVAALPDGLGPVQALNPLPFATDPPSLQRFLDHTLPQARVVLIRLLGGKRALGEQFDLLADACRQRRIPFVACAGEPQRDAQLESCSSVPPLVAQASFEYLRHGGVANLRTLLCFLSDELLGSSLGYSPPQPLPRDGLYRPGRADEVPLDEYLRSYCQPERPTAGLLFYRAHWVSRNLAFVDALVSALESHGCNVLPVFCSSLRDDGGAVFSRYLLDSSGSSRVDVALCTLSFALAHQSTGSSSEDDGVAWTTEVLERLNVPVIQAVVSMESRARWQERSVGLGPLDIAMNVALPELDGRVIAVPVSFKESAVWDDRLGIALQRYVPVEDRVASVASLAARYARLRRTPTAKRRVAIILSNYPTKNARLGNAVGLDTPASAVAILKGLQEAGYRVEGVPADGDTLMRQLIDRCSYDQEFLTPEQLQRAAGRVPASRYSEQFALLPQQVRQQMVKIWGEPPGAVYNDGGHLVIAGLSFGNVFVGVQPPRGFGENPIATYHSPDLVPTHHYVAFYRWLRDEFGADAMVHLGKHGTMEWLPGKGVGLSASCYPEVCLPDLPYFYPFIVNNPGEGTQAKRRSHAVIVDHLIPAMTTADSYGDIARVEQLMDEYAQVQGLDPKKLPILRQRIWETVEQARLNEDLKLAGQPQDFDRFLLDVDGYICELKDAQIRDGLHTLGQAPAGEQLLGLLLALTRLPNGQVPGLRHALARALGLDYPSLAEQRGVPLDGLPVPEILRALLPQSLLRSQGDLVERLELLGRRLLEALQEKGFDPATVDGVAGSLLGEKTGEVPRVLRYVCQQVVPALAHTTDEMSNLLRGLEGGFVPPGPAGAPTRGMAGVLPTGRNFYSLDPRSIPSPAAWEVGRELAQALLKKYLAEEGAYPESVGLVVWGTSAMRTQGDDIAQILHLLGVRPLWQEENRRIRGLEVIPLEELRRPRVDVTVRISGFFRDAFPNLIELLDEAVERVAALDEPPESNFVAKHYRTEVAEKAAAGMSEKEARATSLYRIFGSKPGSYGAGILQALEDGRWRTDQDLAEVYSTWGSYAYTRQAHGVGAPKEFRQRFASINVAAKNQDNREHDIFDSDDYMQYHGGMIATVRALTGRNPRQFFGDSSDPGNLRVRDLKEEVRRVFRTRVVNPKWMDSMKRHGYKGAFELAATVDYMFGYDATAQVVDDWMYQSVAEAYALDPAMQEFFQKSNPWALRSIAERLLEAADRGLWEQPSQETLQALRRVYLQVEGTLEERQERPPRSHQEV